MKIPQLRLILGSFVLPAALAAAHQKDTSVDGLCPFCTESISTLDHILWECDRNRPGTVLVLKNDKQIVICPSMAKVRKLQISPLIAGKGWITVKAAHEAGDKGCKPIQIDSDDEAGSTTQNGAGVNSADTTMDTSQGKRKELSLSAGERTSRRKVFQRCARTSSAFESAVPVLDARDPRS